MLIRYNKNLALYAKQLRKNMTNAEKATWRMLKEKQFMGFDFHRQKPIGNFIADFYCHALNLVIEIDGISHLEKDVQDNDKSKTEYFNSLGLNILRFTDDEVLGNWGLVEKRLVSYIQSL